MALRTEGCLDFSQPVLKLGDARKHSRVHVCIHAPAGRQCNGECALLGTRQQRTSWTGLRGLRAILARCFCTWMHHAA